MPQAVTETLLTSEQPAATTAPAATSQPATTTAPAAATTAAAAAQPAAVSAEDQVKFLVEKGKTAEELKALKPEELEKAFKEAGGKAPEAAKKPEGAPEKYEAFKMPEGVTLDEELVGELGKAAKELNLSQEQAQKVADLGAKQAAKLKTTLEATIAKARTEWADAARADKEIGGDKFNENLGFAKKAMDQFATPEMRAILNQSGLGNHPEMIRCFHRVGKAMAEDKFVSGAAPGADKDIADRLYGKTSAKGA